MYIIIEGFCDNLYIKCEIGFRMVLTALCTLTMSTCHKRYSLPLHFVTKYLTTC